MTYWAHSDISGLPEHHPEARWQPLAEHLANAGSLARRLATLAAPAHAHFQDLAEWAGLLHDFGKYSDCFQQRIRNGTGRCPHAIHGAAIAYATPAHALAGLSAPHLAHAIAGHHAGLPDRIAGLDANVKKFLEEARLLIPRAIPDSPELARLLQSPPPPMEKLSGSFDLFTRMLFSCLVDADRLDSARRGMAQAPLDPAAKLDALMHYAAELSKGRAGVVASARRQVLEDCLAAADFPERLLSLSVPTGGGKTLSAMAFALKRAALQPDAYRRIIVVIPYLSIIEQNADVYAKVFGRDAVLEHHSGNFEDLKLQDEDHFSPVGEDEDRFQSANRRTETENWDAPLIVTTSVRFFESLFSNRPSDLRRVHNIARSIVILDEVQVLPRRLLGALLQTIRELAADWGCSFVFSTATKPAFETSAGAPRALRGADLRWPAGTVREIVRSPGELFAGLRRVTIDWRIKQPADWPEVAGWMLAHQQALCIVNTRDHASKLFDELASRCGQTDALFHLSTRMCAAHRLQKIHAIRQRLAEGSPCLVVSTQLIEAGVDVDFPVAFRAMGPLDSIVQTAGRADREGKLTARTRSPAGIVIVFLPLDHKTPPNEYREAADVAQALAATRDIQCDDLEAMQVFFERYYSAADLGAKYIEHRARADFATLAKEFEMISSRTQDVFVPFGEGAEHIDRLGKIGQLTFELRRKLQRYTVGLQPWEFAAAKGVVLWEARPDTNLWIASDASYSAEKGFETFLRPEALIH